MLGGSAAGAGPELLVIGTNHRNAPPELRERFALVEADLAGALDALAGAELGEAALLVTCDRVELVTTAPDAERAAAALTALLADRTGLPPSTIAASLYRLAGAAALRHLFAVASALDGSVIGEPQVLGQVKTAHRLAAERGLARAELEIAFAAAYRAARRVRRETRIAERPVSIAAAALRLARDLHGDLARATALLIGGGEMGELMAEQFHQSGLRRLVVCGLAAPAAEIAERLSGTVAAAAALDDALAGADIVIAATGGTGALAATRVAAALRRRPSRPLFVIDAAVPAAAEPAINDLEGAFLYDLGDLERAALSGRATREAASAEAWRIVDDELAAFAARRAERRAVPALVALREHVEALRRQALDEAGNDAAAATRLLANRLLHHPSETLRELMGAMPAEAAAMEELLRRLFRLYEREETLE
jgi:glutamyl-tRNA reductase